MAHPFGTLFRTTLKALLVHAGWNLDVLETELSLDEPPATLEFLQGHAVRVKFPHGGGPVISTRVTDHEKAAYVVCEQVHDLIRRVKLTRPLEDLRVLSAAEVAERLKEAIHRGRTT